MIFYLGSQKSSLEVWLHSIILVVLKKKVSIFSSLIIINLTLQKFTFFYRDFGLFLVVKFVPHF